MKWVFFSLNDGRWLCTVVHDLIKQLGGKSTAFSVNEVRTRLAWLYFNSYFAYTSSLFYNNKKTWADEVWKQTKDMWNQLLIVLPGMA